jgi:FkbM family methyltransferase
MVLSKINNIETIDWFHKNLIILYGAGNAGQSAARNIIKANGKVSAFIDQNAKSNQMIEGIPVFTLANWLSIHDPRIFNVIVSIFNPHVDVKVILKDLSEFKFGRVTTYVEYINLFPEDACERLWMAPSSFYSGKESIISEARQLFADKLSLSWFDGIMHLRIKGKYDLLPDHTQDDQYMPSDIPHWQNKIRLIDCGACDGDTIQHFLNAGYSIDSVVAFEPDENNFNKLCNLHRNVEATFIPCGVSDRVCQLKFDANLGVSSRLNDSGSTLIQCISIDQAIPNFAPNLIKMDIEGAELSALKGAEATIRKHKPNLAISIYHKPEDIFELPLWVHSLNVGYKMYLRGHGPNAIDSVLYCVAY